MKSFEVLQSVIDRVGVKQVAAEMKLFPTLVYKWCEHSDKPAGCGTLNPLDRVAKLYEVSRDPAPIAWLCQQANGFYCPNPAGKAGAESPAVLKSIQVMLKEFSDVLDVIAGSYQNDGNIDAGEAQRIRREWEHLKASAESFVVACEKGAYRKKGQD
jgi:hypothetical protein